MGADAVVYVGDDVTDEHAFTALGEGDLTVKVGDGRDGSAVPGRDLGCGRRPCSSWPSARCGWHEAAPCTQNPARRSGAAPVEARTTSSGRKTYSARGAGSPAISSSSARTAASAIAWTHWRTVVSGGSVNAIERRVVVADDRDVLRHPQPEPSARRGSRPSAIRSEPQTTAVQPRSISRGAARVRRPRREKMRPLDQLVHVLAVEQRRCIARAEARRSCG